MATGTAESSRLEPTNTDREPKGAGKRFIKPQIPPDTSVTHLLRKTIPPYHYQTLP